jgi:hypothetical protein
LFRDLQPGIVHRYCAAEATASIAPEDLVEVYRSTVFWYFFSMIPGIGAG